jgi:hypothetical protein
MALPIRVATLRRPAIPHMRAQAPVDRALARSRGVAMCERAKARSIEASMRRDVWACACRHGRAGSRAPAGGARVPVRRIARGMRASFSRVHGCAHEKPRASPASRAAGGARPARLCRQAHASTSFTPDSARGARPRPTQRKRLTRVKSSGYSAASSRSIPARSGARSSAAARWRRAWWSLARITRRTSSRVEGCMLKSSRPSASSRRV